MPEGFECGFCRQSKEPEEVYKSHPLKLNGVLFCPILRKYVCPICKATGDQAHTIKRCPRKILPGRVKLYNVAKNNF